MKSKPRAHFTAPYLINPVHPVTVDLVGAGGNGSQMLTCLARTDHALRVLGHPGLYVTVWDPDTVEAPNIGRQLFCAAEIGLNKAEALVTRVNRFYGLGWEAEDRAFKPGTRVFPNIIVTCVDNIALRREIGNTVQSLRRSSAKSAGPYTGATPEGLLYYWLDLGNGQRTGQAVLGSINTPQPEGTPYEAVADLPFVSEQFDLSSVNEEDSGPSCSMAEALHRQDLFINSTLAQMSGSLLWCVLHDHVTDVRGFFLNLDALTASPIRV